MGALAMTGAVLFFWRFVSRRAALILLGFMAFGLLAYWFTPNPRPCQGRTWFCSFVPDRPIVPAVPKPCPPAEPITTRIFQSDAAEAEVRRQIQAGVCQQDAIERVAKGWHAQYDPAYGS